MISSAKEKHFLEGAKKVIPPLSPMGEIGGIMRGKIIRK